MPLRIAYVTSGVLGYLFRFVPIGRQLLRRNHQVTIITASEHAARHAAGEGFATVHLAGQEQAFAALPEVAWSGPAAPVLRRLPGIGLGPRRAAIAAWAQRARVMSDGSELLAALDAVDPHLVLTEAEEHRDIRLLVGAGRTVLLFEDLYSTRPGPDVPFPARSHQVPNGSWRSRVRARSRWQRFFAVEAVRRRAEAWWVRGHDWSSTIERLATDAFDPGSTSRRYLQFYDYTTLPRLRTIATELAFAGEPQPVVPIGPIVDLDRAPGDVDDRFAARWTDVTAARAAGARVVYISLGTFLSGLRELTSTVIEAVSSIDGVEAVVSVGRDADLWRDADLPPNVAVFASVPQLEVLAACDAVVSTGGLNTGHEALWFGVPVLNLPVAGVDTPGNAARLAYHGVGSRLTPDDITVTTVGERVRSLLDDETYRDAAARIATALHRYCPIDDAVAAIEAHGITSDPPSGAVGG